MRRAQISDTGRYNSFPRSRGKAGMGGCRSVARPSRSRRNHATRSIQPPAATRLAIRPRICETIEHKQPPTRITRDFAQAQGAG